MILTSMAKVENLAARYALDESVLVFQARLYELLGVESSSPLYAPLCYSLQGGQMIRARLTLVVAAHYNIPVQTSYNLAASIEMLHAFSLIQDDLPCMDNDNVRRGKASLHKHFGEPTALLTANSLFAKSFELLVQAAHYSPRTAIQLVALHSNISGAHGMSLGQWHDLSTVSSDLTSLIEIYRLKTGVLFGASLQIPSILANADKNQQRLLAELGEVLGIIYQIQDDMMDYKKNDTLFGGAEPNNICCLGENTALAVLEEHATLAKKHINDLGVLGQAIKECQSYHLTRL
jgi:geranylgeranyl pyrophosphate synthase